jgi:CheY-like chemotaxis protein
MSFCVLIVEPNTDAREMYGACFEHHGIVVHAWDGTSGGLGVMPSVDAIVMAGRLPCEWHALTLVEQLRSDPRTRAVPIIMLSGTGSADEARRAALAGCDHVLTIPCLPDDLLWTVRRAIARRRFKTPRMIRVVAAETRRGTPLVSAARS